MRVVLAAMMAFVGAGIGGCANEGSFERAGEEIDDAIDDVGDGIEDAVDDVGDEIEDARRR